MLPTPATTNHAADILFMYLMNSCEISFRCILSLTALLNHKAVLLLSPIFLSFSIFSFFLYYYYFLAVSGLSCSMRGLS